MNMTRGEEIRAVALLAAVKYHAHNSTTTPVTGIAREFESYIRDKPYEWER